MRADAAGDVRAGATVVTSWSSCPGRCGRAGTRGATTPSPPRWCRDDLLSCHGSEVSSGPAGVRPRSRRGGSLGSGGRAVLGLVVACARQDTWRCRVGAGAYADDHVREVRGQPVAGGPGRGVRGRPRRPPARRDRRRHPAAARARLQRRADQAGAGDRDAPSPPRARRRPGAAADRAALGPGAVVGQGPQDRQPHDQRPHGDGGRQARLQARVRRPPVPAARRRLLRVVRDRPAHRQGQAGQAAVLHPSPRRGRPGDGRALRDLARPRQGQDRSRRVLVDVHGAHDDGGGRARPPARPDAAAGGARPVGHLARSRSRRQCRAGHPARLLVPAAPGRLQAYPVSREVNSVQNNGPQLVDPLPVDED